MQSLSESSRFSIAAATPADCADLVALIAGLAEYEQLTHLLEVTPAALHEHLFGAQPSAEAAIARDADGSALGFALWFRNFSTFLGKPGLYLEDLFVVPAARGRGVGKALIGHVGALAVERGCGRFEWSVLDWNASAIGFYESLGATVMPEWRIVRVTGAALAAFGRPAAR
ncbi:GNAT family N-acetyltransferase [Derxia lacustris]|uniref:GNAT family N-acetyltransferase n=1 Tax=Derxia lacustris TaxID=764842 RepID=UPI000A17126E|nr:GNAT family N-acetyltransferase [Derxia lacustris]